MKQKWSIWGYLVLSRVQTGVLDSKEENRQNLIATQVLFYLTKHDINLAKLIYINMEAESYWTFQLESTNDFFYSSINTNEGNNSWGG